MFTLLLSHPACLEHRVPEGHPECPERLAAVLAALEAEEFAYLAREEAPRASPEAIHRVHPASHLARIAAACAGLSGADIDHLDPDTVLSAGSGEAMLRAAGAVIQGVDAVMSGAARNVFCAVRPPGHHAEPSLSMGFCLLNNVAIGALHARAVHGLARIAVIDFDVHHGNGTEAVFRGDPGLFYASTHQMPLFPGTGHPGERGDHDTILNLPLAPGSGSESFRALVTDRLLPRLDAFGPELILISAGFDGHMRDPLAQLRLTEADYAWITEAILSLADKHCAGRIVSTLEGGYDLTALARSAAAHVRALMGG